MRRTIRQTFAAAMLAAISFSSAWAQQSVRVQGTITAVDGPTLTVKSSEGAEMKVKVADNARVFGVVKATLADIKPGAYVGVGAMAQADGSQRAVQFTIFSEDLRGSGEGHRPWTRGPQSTMTNATVDTTATVSGAEGQVVVLKYKDGEQKIVVPADATVLQYITSDKSELKPGAPIASTAVKQPDGTLEVARINVGRGGVMPQ
jgi:hypothetical protein